jgi:hypothetical protein
MKSISLAKISMLFSLLTGLIMVTSCSKDEKKVFTLPTATITKPTDGQVFYRGNTIFFSASFQSERGLKECTLYLRESKSMKGWDDPWTPEQTIPLTGHSMSVDNEILFEPNIPFDIKSTNYELVLLVVDLDLNFSTYQIPIVIE